MELKTWEQKLKLWELLPLPMLLTLMLLVPTRLAWRLELKAVKLLLPPVWICIDQPSQPLGATLSVSVEGQHASALESGLLSLRG